MGLPDPLVDGVVELAAGGNTIDGQLARIDQCDTLVLRGGPHRQRGRNLAGVELVVGVEGSLDPLQASVELAEELRGVLRARPLSCSPHSRPPYLWFS